MQRNTLMDPARLAAAAASLRVPTLLVRGGQSDVLGDFLDRRIRSEGATRGSGRCDSRVTSAAAVGC
ncbi:MAG: hypothetical protein GEV04_02180 [Actinophytocola sp.]|nr:hypothetical protein [Actinophytocola sp.]